MLGVQRQALRSLVGVRKLSSETVSAFPADLLKDRQLLRDDSYVNGAWTHGDKTRRFDVFNPSNGRKVASVADLTRLDTRDAIKAAHREFPLWSRRLAADRCKVLRKWFYLVEENADDLGTIMTLEAGKPKKEAVGEIGYAASFIEWFSEEGKRLSGEYMDAGAKRAMTVVHPVGVCAAITPWNFPAAMITRKAAAALAAGCTMVVKPDPQTPLTALALAELAERAGIPRGVLNIVTTRDAKEVGHELTTNRDVRKVSFTGSTRVGKLLMEQAARTVKRVSMELGGVAPFIVMESADLPAAAQALVYNKFRNGGQTCVSANRIYAHTAIHDRFVDEVRTLMQRLTVGDGFQDVAIGPLINVAAVDKVREHVDDAVGKGAKLVLGGRPMPELGTQFFAPTLLSEVPDLALVASHETFGPVAPVLRFESEREVIEKANDSDYGLAAYVFTNNLSQGIRISEKLEYGMVGLNESAISDARMPFGGVKHSGIGREGGSVGLDEYLDLKYICVGRVHH